MSFQSECDVCGLAGIGKNVYACKSKKPNRDDTTVVEKISMMNLFLKEKDVYFICQNCDNIVEELYCKFLKSNLDCKRSKTENVMTTFDEQTDYIAEEIEQLPIHQLSLSKFCRVCKSSRFDHVRNMDSYDKNSKLILKVCKLMSMEPFESEDANRYPTYLCHKCFLLFSKTCTHLLTSQTTSKITCATFPLHTVNCTLCASLTEKDLTAFEIEPNEAKSTQWIHYENLRNLCRICGSLMSKRQVSKTADLLQNCVLTLYNCKFDNEDPNIYPFSVCNYCANKLNTFCYQKERNMQVSIPQLYKFKPHSDNCEICFKYSDAIDDNAKKIAVRLLSDIETPYNENRSTALYFHMQKLLRYCRICGLPNVKFSGSKIGKLKSKEEVMKVINYSVLKSLADIQVDNKYLYPPALCNICWTKLNINYNLKLNGKKSLVKWHVTFKNHKECCAVCSTSQYGPGIPEISTNIEKVFCREMLKFPSYLSSVCSVEDVLLKACIKQSVDNSIVMYGLPLEQLISKLEKAENLACGGCLFIPSIPLVTKCQHIICRHCIKSIFEIDHICPHNNCSKTITPDLVWTSKSMLDHINSLAFACKNSHNDMCTFNGNMKAVIEHEQSCSPVKNLNSCNYPRTNEMQCSPIPLKQTNDEKYTSTPQPISNETKVKELGNENKDLQNNVFKKVIDFIDDYCAKNCVKKSDVIDFLSNLHGESIIKELPSKESVSNGMSLKKMEDKEIPRKRKLCESSEPVKCDKLLPDVDYAPSKKLSTATTNVWDISSHECQLNLLSGSNCNVPSNYSKPLLFSENEDDSSTESNVSYSGQDCWSPNSSECEQLKICTPLKKSPSYASDSDYKPIYSLSSDGKIVEIKKDMEEWNYLCKSENASQAFANYLQVPQNGDALPDDDLLSESSSDEASDE